MVIGKAEIISRIRRDQLVSNLISPSQIQQAGVDLTVGKVYMLQGEGALDFDNTRRRICKYENIPMVDEGWVLEPGTFHCAMNERIKIPADLCGLLLPRSSALACGLTIHTALWDPGYEGRSFMHTVATKRVKIFRNARLAQMIFLPVQGEASTYSGTYLGEDVLIQGHRGKQETIDDWEVEQPH